MTLKCTMAVFTALLSITLCFAQSIHCPNDDCTFLPEEKVYVFGNDVKLRAEPNTESKVLELLKIGEWVQIIEKAQFSWPYKGFDSPFYKVKYDDMTGYILGGLLALERKTIDGTNYFFAYSKEGQKTFLNIRSMHLDHLFEKKILLGNTNISIETHGDRGIEGLDGIIYIDYVLGEDGENHGGIYVFAFKGALTVYELSQFNDLDVSYSLERFIFPDEKDGIPGKVIFKKKRAYDFLYKEDEWGYTNLETWRLRWTGAELVPNFRQKSMN